MGNILGNIRIIHYAYKCIDMFINITLTFSEWWEECRVKVGMGCTKEVGCHFFFTFVFDILQNWRDRLC